MLAEASIRIKTIDSLAPKPPNLVFIMFIFRPLLRKNIHLIITILGLYHNRIYSEICYNVIEYQSLKASKRENEMKINSIILENFRNYNMLECFPDPKLNIIIGENAQGKTNLIEAIYISAFAKSFRTNRSQEMIKFGAERARVHLDVTSEELEHSINIVLLNDGKKKITKDGKGIRKATELLNTVVVVVFSPEDLRIIKDSPEKRRNFINRELSQIRPAYYEALRSYGEALKQKNALIKGYFNIRKKTFTRADNLVLNESSNIVNNEGNNIYDNSRQFNEDMLDVYDQQQIGRAHV